MDEAVFFCQILRDLASNLQLTFFCFSASRNLKTSSSVGRVKGEEVGGRREDGGMREAGGGRRKFEEDRLEDLRRDRGLEEVPFKSC